MDAVRGLRFIERPAEKEIAVERLREEFWETALAWAEARPANADAREALAISLLMLGDLSALDTVSVARSLASDDETAFRIAGTEVWMRLAFGLLPNFSRQACRLPAISFAG